MNKIMIITTFLHYYSQLLILNLEIYIKAHSVNAS